MYSLNITLIAIRNNVEFNLLIPCLYILFVIEKDRWNSLDARNEDFENFILAGYIEDKKDRGMQQVPYLTILCESMAERMG